jgi:hypothetical protein
LTVALVSTVDLYPSSEVLKKRFWKRRIKSTPNEIEASAILNTGRKNSKDSPPQTGTQLGNLASVIIGK